MRFPLASLALSLGLATALPLTSDSSSSKFPSHSLVSNSSTPQHHNASFGAGASHAAAAVNSNWWYANIDHTSGAVRDYAPNLFTGNNPDYNYQVYYSIASGDSDGLRNAISAGGPNGNRDNLFLAGEPRVIYLAPGTYTLNSQLNLLTDTIIIGDAVNPPTIKASSGFNGDYLILGGQGDESGGGGEIHFSVMIKNVILDTTANSGNSGFTALSWRVAQNAGLVNMQINMPSGVHTGINLGQGSTIQVGDVSFSRGNVGLHYNGMQQATLKNLKFQYCTTGITIDNGFAINIIAPRFDTCGHSIVLNSGSQWTSIIDGVSVNSGDFFTSNVGYPNFMLENISKDTTNTNMVTVNGNVKLGGITSTRTYVYGNTYGANPVYQTGSNQQNINRPAQIAPNGRYPIITAPQYPDKTVNDVINLKDSSKNGGFTLHGDGSSNDGAALQGALNTAASQGKIAYLPFGIYRTQQTITIPVNTNLVGNGWPTISGYGSLFQDENNPQPVVKVGNAGDVGVAHIQDVRFDVGQALPGAIILQINMAGNSPGDVSLHNSLVTVGGTLNTELSCGNEANCKAAYIGLHLTSTSSAYIDNFWCWVADHAVDNSGKGTRTAGKGGILVEATKGTWLQGVGSEHWWLYQLNFHGASNVFTALFQSETNYNQGDNAPVAPPAPFKATSSDPNFSWCGGDNHCPMGIAQYYNGGSNIFEYAAGSWNFFGGTQTNMNVMNARPSNSHIFGLTDHQAKYIMRLPNGQQFGNGGSDGFGGSWGTLVAQFDP